MMETFPLNVFLHPLVCVHHSPLNDTILTQMWFPDDQARLNFVPERPARHADPSNAKGVSGGEKGSSKIRLDALPDVSQHSDVSKDIHKLESRQDQTVSKPFVPHLRPLRPPPSFETLKPLPPALSSTILRPLPTLTFAIMPRSPCSLQDQQSSQSLTGGVLSIGYLQPQGPKDPLSQSPEQKTSIEPEQSINLCAEFRSKWSTRLCRPIMNHERQQALSEHRDSGLQEMGHSRSFNLTHEASGQYFLCFPLYLQCVLNADVTR